MLRKTPDPNVRLKTVKQVAEEDNVSQKTVRRAIDAGVLEAIRVGPAGRLLRVHPDAHAAYRRRQRPWALASNDVHSCQ